MAYTPARHPGRPRKFPKTGKRRGIGRARFRKLSECPGADSNYCTEPGDPTLGGYCEDHHRIMVPGDYPETPAWVLEG